MSPRRQDHHYKCRETGVVDGTDISWLELPPAVKYVHCPHQLPQKISLKIHKHIFFK